MIVYLRKEIEYYLVKFDDDKIDLLSDLNYYLENTGDCKEVHGGEILGLIEKFTSYDGSNQFVNLVYVIHYEDIFDKSDISEPRYELLQYMSKRLFIYMISLWKELYLYKINKKDEEDDIFLVCYTYYKKFLEDLNKIENNVDKYYDELMIKGIIE